MLAPQVEQAFYLKDTKLKDDWHVVQNELPRNLYDILEIEATEEDEVGEHDEHEQYESY